MLGTNRHAHEFIPAPIEEEDFINFILGYMETKQRKIPKVLAEEFVQKIGCNFKVLDGFLLGEPLPKNTTIDKLFESMISYY